MSKTDPTNAEIMDEIRLIRKDQKALDERIKPLERWKIAFDAADAAIVKYKQEHENLVAPIPPDSPKPLIDGINKDFANIVLKFLGVISLLLTILYFVIQAVADKL